MIPRVLSYPPVHDYVDRLDPDVCRLIHRREKWPSLPHFYSVEWLQAHSAEWDVTHFHFTWEQYSVRCLRDIVQTHKKLRKSIVWTAHDIHNPHQSHEDWRYMEVLAGHADEFVTLTEGAARQLTDTLGRRPQVIPHGPFLDEQTMVRTRAEGPARGGSATLLFHLRSGRTNSRWRPWLDSIMVLIERGWDLQVQVCAHSDHPEVQDLLGWEGRIGCSVRIHDPLQLNELISRLRSVDAIVLPYAWGTHSGLAELAADIGTTVVASSAGFIHEQVPVLSVECNEGVPDRRSLRSAMERLVAGETPDPPSVRKRSGTAEQFLSGHRQMYARLCG